MFFIPFKMNFVLVKGRLTASETEALYFFSTENRYSKGTHIANFPLHLLSVLWKDFQAEAP